MGVAVCLQFAPWAHLGRSADGPLPSLFPFVIFSPFVCATCRIQCCKGKAVKYLQANLYLLGLWAHQRISFCAVSFQLVLVGSLLPNPSSCFTTNSSTSHVSQSCYCSISYSDVPFTIVLGLMFMYSVQ